MTYSLCTHVAGAGFKQNPGKLVEGECVYLQRNPENPVHSNAIAVLNTQQERTGWIPRELADSLSPAMRDQAIKNIRCVVESKKEIRIFFEKQ
jgi:hypothetical protein